jgi:replicative DNA helicase
LKNPEKIIECEEEIEPKHFLVPAHRYIYTSILYLYSKNITPTPLAINEVLVNETARQELNKMGGLEYLTTLAQTEVHEDNLYIYCQKILQAYTRHQIVNICYDTIDNMVDDKSEVLNPSELIEIVEKKISTLNNNVTQKSEVYKMGDKTEEILKERAEQPSVVPGLEVGFQQFDRYTNGGQPGDLIVVCGRSKTGKSTLLTNWATKLAIYDKIPILYIDTEMNEREQEDRILAILAGIPHSEIISGMYVLDTEYGTAKEKIAKLKHATQILKESEYYHVYMPHFTLEKVNAIAKQFKTQKQIGALFFDYLKVPSNQMGSLKTVQEWQMLGFLASGLKDLAGLLNIPCYSAVQENRTDIKNTKKDASNIGGSDRILHLATKLIFIYNKTDEDIAKEGIINGNQQLYIAYQRNGLSDCPPINIMFNRPFLKQEEV